MLRQLPGSVSLSFPPLSTLYVSALLGITKDELNHTLDVLHSILYVAKDKAGCLVSIILRFAILFLTGADVRTKISF